MPRKKQWIGRKKVGKHPARWVFKPKRSNTDVFAGVAHGSLADNKPLALECGVIHNNGLLPERFTTLDLSLRCQSPSWCIKFLQNNGIYPASINEIN